MSDPVDPAPARCHGERRRALIAETHALGVPRDYGRQRRLAPVREPRELMCIGEDIHGRRQWLAPRAARAYARMTAAAAADAIELQLVSAYRSAEYQFGILERKLARGQAIEAILRVSAAPGYSEHHSGRAVDLTTPGFAALEEAFEHSSAFAWLVANAQRFGFRLSYPRDNPHGIAYEPWHWCWHRA
ncbi:M15 family metallopeptidase [Dokdonella sp.]|uniref:M15 family metallopeptidase n=1 Tax=Dokdonella sp. TaxID=2291710 RepID=UPI0039C88164